MAEKTEPQGFKTLAEAEEAYAKLETKLGKQGEELGTLRQQTREFTSSLQQYATWAEKAAPIVDWYAKNEGEVKRRWDLAERQTAQPQNGAQAAAAGAVQQAGELATQDPRFQWLTPQEKQALIGDIAQNLMQQHLAPWTQTFSRQAQEFAQNAQNALAAQLKSNNDVMWRSLSYLHPKEKIDELRKWHDQSLKFADPSKLDPMQHAQEWMNLSSENQTLKQQLEDIQKKQQERDKVASPSIAFGAPPEAASGAQPRATSKDERMTRAMEAVKAEHGADGVHALFGSQTNLT